jgi:hypothetical protein
LDDFPQPKITILKRDKMARERPVALMEQPYLKAKAALRELLGVTSIAKLLGHGRKEAVQETGIIETDTYFPNARARFRSQGLE